jgi:hypothetical protein
MKKSILLFAAGLIGSIAMTISFIRLSRLFPIQKSFYYVFGIILMVMLTSTIIYFKRMLDELRGIPSTDEMTENIGRMAAAKSFPRALSMWIIILIFTMGSDNAFIPISTGIIGMALIYGINWLSYKKKGNTND